MAQNNDELSQQRKRSIERLQKGKEFWNAWAIEMLEKRDQLITQGKWDEQAKKWNQFDVNEETRNWFSESLSNFCDVHFTSEGTEEINADLVCKVSDFTDIIFPGEAWFTGAKFHNKAIFTKTFFYKNTVFERAVFEQDAEFRKARFYNEAWFGSSTFNGPARFYNARFNGIAFFDDAKFYNTAMLSEVIFANKWQKTDFSYATFKGVRCSFSLVQFRGEVSFQGINVERAFEIGNASFSQLPDFTMAHFSESPRFDYVRFQPTVEGMTFFPSLVSPLNQKPISLKDSIAKWRAIRRLAIQSHDHQVEHDALKGEIRLLRLPNGKKKDRSYYWGIAYDIFSDLGSSATRPMLYLGLSVVIFSLVYYVLLFSEASCGLFDSIVSSVHLSFNTGLKPFSSEIQENNTMSANALLILKQKHAPAGYLWIDVITLLQKVMSAFLLFLAGLGLRNMFRIK